MRFQDVVFMPPKLDFTPHFLKIVVEAMATGPPCALRLLLEISKGMRPVRYF